MTQLGGGQSGSIPFPYMPSTDDNVNKHAVATTGKDVLQCMVSLLRNANTNEYNVVFIDPDKNQYTAQGILAKDQDSLTVQTDLLPLKVTATDAVGEVGTVGSEIGFYFGSEDDPEPGTDFQWTTVTTGTDPTLSDRVPDTLPGGYCVVPNIKDDDGASNGLQNVECWFPCNAS